MGCDCCEEPISDIRYGQIEAFANGSHAGVSGGANGSTATAWANAVAAIPAYPASFTSFVPLNVLGGYGAWDSGLKRLVSGAGSPPAIDASALARRVKYQWRFYTATCYAKFWWNEVTYRDQGASYPTVASTTVVGTVAKEYVWTPISVDGLCLPSDIGDGGDVTKWPVSDTFELTEIEPANVTTVNHFERTRIVLEGFKWSWIDGYEPTDETDSGFPPA